MHVQLASEIFYKELIISETDMAQLGSEQKGALDWLVLKRAKRLLGFKPSSYSQKLVDYRDLEDITRNSSMLLQIPRKHKDAKAKFPDCY